MKWVTFHWSIMYGVQDLKVHDSKKDAAKYFNRNCKNYFEICGPIRVQPPCCFGFPHRKFCVMSGTMFKKKFKEGKYV